MAAVEIETKDSWATQERPRGLDDVIGQPNGVALIKGLIKRKEFPNAVMFTGSTGSGKTTFAKIVGGLLTGSKNPDNDPNIVEINASDKRSIEDVREIIRSLPFLPQGGSKFRFIILDEIQGWQKQQASAFLKPLESPPKHIIFALCTDQPDKLMDTMRGRCLKVPLRRIMPDDVYPLLKRIAKNRKVDFGKNHKDILRKIAETTGGQPRESVQLLQGVAAIHTSGSRGEDSLNEAIEALAGVATEDAAIKMILAAYLGKPEAVLSAVADADDHAGMLNIALECHQYLLDQVSKTRRTYAGTARRKLQNLMNERGVWLPKLKHVLGLHSVLTEIKAQSNLYALPEKHLLSTRVGTWALSQVR